jgi:VWFA-related protein
VRISIAKQKPFFLPTLFLGLLLAAATWAQDAGQGGAGGDGTPGGEPNELFFETTEVNVVNVEVFVTDKQGNRVNGLTRDDFEIYESGQKMEITNFFAVENGRPVSGPAADAEPAEEAGDDRLPDRSARLSKLAELPELPEDQRLHLIIYIDNFNLRPATRNRVLNRMHRFLNQKLSPGDRVMVVSYDRSLHIRQPFTNDMELVAEALDGLEELSGIAVMRDAERRTALEEIDVSSDSFEALQWAHSYADSAYAELDFTIEALTDHVNALSGLVGRKALLYVSDGLPQVVAEDVFIAVDERFRDSRARLDALAYDLGPRYRELVAKANAGGVTFYTLEAGGLQAHASVSAEYGGSRQGGGQAFIDSIRTANLREPLHILADDTGGRAIVNTNAVEAGLDQVGDDFGNYYSLGYQPPHHGDGRYYKIEVKVRGKGLEVRHRNGYRDATPEARLTNGSIASLYFNYETNPLGASLAFGAVSPHDQRNQFLLPLTVKVPIDRLALAPREDQSLIGRFLVAVAVMDEDGRVSPVQQQQPVSLAIPPADVPKIRGKHFAYDVTLLVRKGVVRVAVAVRDELGTQTSFIRETIRVDPG